MIRFFLSLIAVGLILAGAAWYLMEYQLINTLPSYFYQTLIFLFFGTGLVYVYLYKFDKPDFFVQLYLLTMAVKLLAYGAYNFVIILDDKTGAIGNVAWFLVLYLTFTVVEIAFLYRKISR